MPHASSQALTDQLQVLFGAGTCAGLTDVELIDRFRTSRDEGGERAFEALVTRHGPMVMSVCRNILNDPTDIHDAFQATFLVLARRAGSIRKRESVGSWLYGVAVRVAARSRVSSIRRQICDRRTIAAAGTVAAVATESRSTPSIDREEGAAMVHQEVERLPEKYRAPIVLCYLEGLTHDEAAARLKWPVGTVRSRLSRARDTLRSRLTRRGVTAPSTFGSVGAWLMSDPDVLTTAASSALPVHLSTSLARSATRFAIGQPVTAGSLSAVALRLAQGVLTTMMLKKLTIAGCVILSLGLAGVGGGALLVRASRAQEAKAAPASAPNQATKAITESQIPKADIDELKPFDVADTANDDIDALIQKLLQAARLRINAQRAYYEEGRITIDRYINASKQLEIAELRAAKGDAERLAIRRQHIGRLKEIERRERAELIVGRGTVADVAEAVESRLEAEYELKASEKEAAEKSTMLRRLSELERKVEEFQRERAAKPARKP